MRMIWGECVRVCLHSIVVSLDCLLSLLSMRQVHANYLDQRKWSFYNLDVCIVGRYKATGRSCTV